MESVQTVPIRAQKHNKKQIYQFQCKVKLTPFNAIKMMKIRFSLLFSLLSLVKVHKTLSNYD